MKNPGDQNVVLMTVVDDVVLDCEGSYARTELRTSAAHPRMFSQPLESVDDRVDELIGGGGAGVLGDVGPDLIEVLLGQSGQPIGQLRLLGAGRATARLDPLGQLPT